MRRRLRKKLHRRVLVEQVIDLSLKAAWRRRLLSAPEGRPHRIDRDHLDDVPPRLAATIRVHGLRFAAARVAADERAGELVPFAFWALEFPAVIAWSWNNPRVV